MKIDDVYVLTCGLLTLILGDLKIFNDRARFSQSSLVEWSCRIAGKLNDRGNCAAAFVLKLNFSSVYAKAFTEAAR